MSKWILQKFWKLPQRGRRPKSCPQHSSAAGRDAYIKVSPDDATELLAAVQHISEADKLARARDPIE